MAVPGGLRVARGPDIHHEVLSSSKVGVWDTAEGHAVDVRSADCRERCACVRCKEVKLS
jgi:hypothetical protein